jgi:UDPglucose 6-dehydrogenase
MNICVIGAGYVGLVTATCFSEKGHLVKCIDIDENKIKNLNSGNVPIYEPGLEKIFEKNINNKRLLFSSHLESGINDSNIIFLALPTPSDDDGSADLQYVLNVSKEIGKLIKDYKIIVTKSTVPVGTSKLVKKEIQKNYNGDFDVVSNPEFLREGLAINDFMKPDRIVIGTESTKAIEIMEDLYSPFVKQGNPVIFMDNESAELTKYAANSFLATKISFMNEISYICEKFDANIDLIRKGIGFDHRISNKFLYAGIGYGGSCFPKDVKALITSAKSVDYDFKILNAVNTVNNIQKTLIIKKLKKHFKNVLLNKNISIWGLAFKPNTDDVREAPSITIINNLIEEGCNINVYDPEASDKIKDIFGDKIKYSKNKFDTLIDSNALIIATEWSEFANPDFDFMKKLMKEHCVFDGRNLYNPQKMKNMGFKYFSIGR